MSTVSPTSYFHFAPTLLGPGSIVMPGNFGRLIQLHGSQHPLWQREQALENIRALHYASKPSRLASCFAYPTEAIARQSNQVLATTEPSKLGDVLYEVEPTDSSASQHRSDFNVVQPLPGRPESMDQIAHLYWTAGLWITIQGYPGLKCEEIVTASPLRILKML
jgi:hypothetical protein